nr:hypothetical protein K4M20_00326 [Agrobacterium fabrum]
MMQALSTFMLVLAARLFTALVQLWVIATLVFSIMYIMPGDPVLLLLGPESNPLPQRLLQRCGTNLASISRF